MTVYGNYRLKLQLNTDKFKTPVHVNEEKALEGKVRTITLEEKQLVQHIFFCKLGVLEYILLTVRYHFSCSDMLSSWAVVGLHVCISAHVH